MLSLSASSRVAAGTLLENPSSFLTEPTGAAPAAKSVANKTATQPQPASVRTIIRSRIVSLVIPRKLPVTPGSRQCPNYCLAKINLETGPSPAANPPRTKKRVFDNINSVKTAAAQKFVRVAIGGRDCGRVGQSSALGQ